MDYTHKGKILVVDDEKTVCKSMRQAIVTEGFEVDLALSGDEALKKDEENRYSLIITDLMMPGISGLGLLKKLKSRRPGVNVIIVTGYPTIKTAVESIKLGAFDYIPKPFTPAELRGIVHRVFQREQKDKEGIFSPPVPSGLFLMIGHTWLRPEEKNRVFVGVMADFLKSVGPIQQVELPQVGQSITQGEACAKVIDDKYTHRIWSPATGRVININHDLRADPELIQRSPYGKGWLFEAETLRLEEDIKGLVPSE